MPNEYIEEGFDENFKSFCKLLGLREETVGGFDEIAYAKRYITKLLTQTHNNALKVAVEEANKLSIAYRGMPHEYALDQAIKNIKEKIIN